MSVQRLYRSRDDKIIAGVCGGIAEHFRVDPVWIRLLLFLLLFFQGIGLIIYVIAWVLIPVNPKHVKPVKTVSTDRTYILGIALIGVGAVFLLNNLFSISLKYLAPIAVIALGVYLIQRKK